MHKRLAASLVVPNSTLSSRETRLLRPASPSQDLGASGGGWVAGAVVKHWAAYILPQPSAERAAATSQSQTVWSAQGFSVYVPALPSSWASRLLETPLSSQISLYSFFFPFPDKSGPGLCSLCSDPHPQPPVYLYYPHSVPGQFHVHPQERLRNQRMRKENNRENK